MLMAAQPQKKNTPLWGIQQANLASVSTFLACCAWLLLAATLQDYDARLTQTTAATKLDMRWSYDVGDVLDLLNAYGPAGRSLYAELCWVDMLFAVSVGIVGHSLIGTFGNGKSLRLLLLAPWGFCVLDLLENALLLQLLSAPTLHESSVALASVVTRLKLSALLITYASYLVAVGRMAARVLLQRAPYEDTYCLSRTQQRSIALVAASVAAVLSVLQSSIWHGGSAPGWMLDCVPRHIWSDPAANYDRFGRLFLLVPLSLLVVLAQAAPTNEPPEPCTAFSKYFPGWLSRLALVAVVADAGTYWFFGWSQPELRKLVFWGLEVPAYALLGLGTSIHGWLSWRRRRDARALASIGLLPSMLFCAAVFQYLPHALALPAVALSPWLPRPRRQTVPSALEATAHPVPAEAPWRTP